MMSCRKRRRRRRRRRLYIYVEKRRNLYWLVIKNYIYAFKHRHKRLTLNRSQNPWLRCPKRSREPGPRRGVASWQSDLLASPKLA